MAKAGTCEICGMPEFVHVQKLTYSGAGETGHAFKAIEVEHCTACLGIGHFGVEEAFKDCDRCGWSGLKADQDRHPSNAD